MVNAGRIACIAAPFLLSVAALATLVVIFLAGTQEGNDTLGDLYFIKFDLENLTLNAASDNSNTLTTLGAALEVARQTLGMTDFYTVYLRNQCNWNGNDDYSNCTSPSSYYWFNPIREWGLDDAEVPLSDFIPGDLQDGLDLYQRAAKAMFILYAAALAACSLTILVGFSAMFSRWGSFFTTFFAGIATLSYVTSSIVASAMFSILRGAIASSLEDDYNVRPTLGRQALILTWIGSAFAAGAGIFWFASICCCSGRSPYNKDRGRGKTRAEKTPYTYERVGSPYMGPNASQAVPLGAYNGAAGPSARGGAYEPFRSHA